MGSQGGTCRNVTQLCNCRYTYKRIYYFHHFFSKDVRLPHSLQRAMAAEAEATREAKAKIVAAEGEFKASTALKQASDIIGMNPIALQVFFLVCLT